MERFYRSQRSQYIFNNKWHKYWKRIYSSSITSTSNILRLKCILFVMLHAKAKGNAYIPNVNEFHVTNTIRNSYTYTWVPFFFFKQHWIPTRVLYDKLFTTTQHCRVPLNLENVWYSCVHYYWLWIQTET